MRLEQRGWVKSLQSAFNWRQEETDGGNKTRQHLKATRKWNFRNRTELSLADIGRMYNPILRGWLEYYGRFCPSALYPMLRHVNRTLVAWAMRKYRRLKGHKTRASLFIEGIAQRQPGLFVHWQRGMMGAFA
jgi:RNA-directed DNA polymerase